MRRTASKVALPSLEEENLSISDDVPKIHIQNDLRETLADRVKIVEKPEENDLFMISFNCLNIKSREDVDAIREIVEQKVRDRGRKVHAIFSYENTQISDEIWDSYLETIRYLNDNFYARIERTGTDSAIASKLETIPNSVVTDVPMAVLGPYEILKTLSKNDFGRECLGKERIGGKEVLIKVMDADEIHAKGCYPLMQRELKYLSSVDHPNFAKCLSAFKDPGKYYVVVTEHLPLPNLVDYVRACGRLPEPEAQSFFRQLVSALVYKVVTLRTRNRHIRLEKILVCPSGQLKVCDFMQGLTHYQPEFVSYLAMGEIGPPPIERSADRALFDSVFGEQAVSRVPFITIRSNVELKSFARVLFYFLTGRIVGTEDMSKFVEGPSLSHVSCECREVLQLLLSETPNLQTILSHPWVAFDASSQPSASQPQSQ